MRCNNFRLWTPGKHALPWYDTNKKLPSMMVPEGLLSAASLTRWAMSDPRPRDCRCSPARSGLAPNAPDNWLSVPDLPAAA